MAEQAQGPVRDVVDYELLFDCVHCGLCLEACPTYILTRSEMDSPRGRIYQMKALAEGRLDPDADVIHHLDFCLGCRGCETACPSGVHYGALIEQTRAWVERNYKRRLADRLQRWIVGALFPYPARLRIALAPLKLIERAGLRPFLERSMPGALREWVELLPPLAARVPAIERSITAAGGDQRCGCGASRMRRAGARRLGQYQRAKPARGLPATGSPGWPARFAAARWTCTAAIASERSSSPAPMSARSKTAAPISSSRRLRDVPLRWPNTASCSRMIPNWRRPRARFQPRSES